MENNVVNKATYESSRNERSGSPGELPLVVIVGPTGSGKSALAVQLARELFAKSGSGKRAKNVLPGSAGEHVGAEMSPACAEIICADSRTIYKGMDIGTAKPTRAEQGGIVHHGLDLVAPDQPFTVADFKKYAEDTINDIRSRGNVPIMVGGSGLYIDAVIYNYDLEGKSADDALREELNALPIEDLRQRLQALGAELPENEKNKRYLVRAIEKATAGFADYSAPDRKRGVRPDAVVLGLDLDRDVLRDRIERRVDAMVEAGLVDEARRLAGQFGWDIQAMQAPAYKSFRGYVEGSQNPADNSADDLAIAKAEFVRQDMKLSKRQVTWFKRNGSIRWIHGIQNSAQNANANGDVLEEAVEILTTQLNNLLP